MSLIWVNQQESNSVHALDRGLAYGDGVFATMRTCSVTDGACAGIHLLSLHLARLKQACARLHLHWDVSDRLIEHLDELARDYPNHCIKLLISRGVGGRGYAPPEKQDIVEVTSVHALPPHYPRWQQQGIALAMSSVNLGHQPLLAGMKHLNRLEQVLIKSAELPSGFDDVLVCDLHQNIIEASMANLIFISGDTAYTPALNHCGVAGVMREVALDTLLGLGINVVAKAIPISELTQYEHVLLTNSLLGAIHVNQIAKHHFKPWPQLAKLNQAIQTWPH